MVTSLPRGEADARELYEGLYCARGEMENRIKEQKLMMFADRVSTRKMHSNQIRLHLSSIAYVLLQSLRRVKSQKCWIFVRGSAPFSGP